MVRGDRMPQAPRPITQPAAVRRSMPVLAPDREARLPDEAPANERVVSDAETLRAIADPLRIAMLEAMLTRAEDAWSVKELAAVLGVPQTRLYHHIELLLERDLIRAASQ